VTQDPSAKSHLQALIRNLIRETHRHKLSYDQLRYIFKTVRKRAQLHAPRSKTQKLYELPSQTELERFYGQISNSTHKLIFQTLETSGLRVAELCNLQVDRIDFRSNLIFVSKGKGQKDRVTVIGNRLKEKLQIYLQGRKNKFLFESNRHTKFSTRRIEQLCQEYTTRAGITKNFTPHTLRHLWNTRLAEAGLSKEKRMILAGHSSEKTQDIYTHLGAGGVKDEVIAILDKS